ncbi:MAG TPA: hypothetical protein DCY38_05285, partial [Opitutae bacterium]|nr:hypothetical protein [Opitutae bacterium]
MGPPAAAVLQFPNTRVFGFFECSIRTSITITLAVACLILSACTPHAEAAERPNILLIMADDLG